MKLKDLKFTLIIVISLISGSAFCQQKAEDLIKSGNLKDSEKNFSGAIEDFDAALKLDSENVNAFYYRGYVYYEMKKYHDAIKDFDEAIYLDSLDVESYFNRGNAKFELEDYKGAIKDYQSAITLNPKDKECYYNKAIAEYNIGDTENVCPDLEQAAKLGDDMAKEAAKALCQ